MTANQPTGTSDPGASDAVALSGVRTADRLAALHAADPQVAAARPRADVAAAVRQPGLALSAIVSQVMQGYADRPALGTRARELVTDPATGRTTQRLLPGYETVSYGELWSRAGALAAYCHHDPDLLIDAGDFVATLGFTSLDDTIVELACIRLGAVSVPLQASATAAQLRPIIAETGPRVLATSVEQLETAVDICTIGTGEDVDAVVPIRRLLVLDYDERIDGQRARFEAARSRLAGLARPVPVSGVSDAIAHGRTLEPVELYVPAPGDDPLGLLIYTSGSTGTPKGAMHTHRLLRPVWCATLSATAGMGRIGLGYLPMSHLAGRGRLFSTLASGGTCYLTANSDLSTFFEDIALARPTEFMFVPRICDMVFQHYCAAVERRGGLDGQPAAVEAAVKAEIRDRLLGGRISLAIVGTAPLSTELATFMTSCLGVPLYDGYGSTEIGAVTLNGRVLRPPVIDYKLVDVPELGYFGTDVPHPRGELLLRSESIFPGYFRRPDVTAEVFDAEGYYRTGDIVAETGPDQLAYVDRRNNVIKLSQGEFVAVARLEAIYATSPLVRQIFLHGSSERAYLLAVVVPTAEALSRPDAAGSLATAITASLRGIGRSQSLNAYEIPRDVLVETEPFSPGNGLLTGAGKLRRPQLRERYLPLLERRYAELAALENGALSKLRAGGADQPVLPTLCRATQALLGCQAEDLRPEAHFADLGGDSLSALSLVALLKDIFDVDVPVGVVTSPATDLRRLAEYVRSARSSAAPGPTFAAVHGVAPATVNAAELTLESFLDAATLSAAADAVRVAGEPTTVLLTGASGYLGRFVCLGWLERLERTGGRLICLVRAADDTTAASRLAAAFDSGDAQLTERFASLSAGRLEVLAGDIAEPDLGLDPATWQRLADTVDLIVHPAALVNHVLPYQQLFGPNVVGTAELIRLSLTSRIKPFGYVSSVAVLGGAAGIGEDDDVRASCPAWRLDDSYANGYAVSKWAGEILLREAHERFGLPVVCLRSDMILAHSRYVGQLNVPDMFTRLLLSLLVTGVAPRSFYRQARGKSDGARPRAHYDGLPVEFTAEAVVTLTATATGYRSFNMVNPHADGIGLDVFVDWLIEAGHPIQRVDDYEAWSARFATALRALPDRQRRHSLLPLLHAYTAPAPPVDGTLVPAEGFRAAVREARIGPDHDIPHLTAALIGKYASDLRHLGLV